MHALSWAKHATCYRRLPQQCGKLYNPTIIQPETRNLCHTLLYNLVSLQAWLIPVEPLGCILWGFVQTGILSGRHIGFIWGVSKFRAAWICLKQVISAMTAMCTAAALRFSWLSQSWVADVCLLRFSRHPEFCCFSDSPRKDRPFRFALNTSPNKWYQKRLQAMNIIADEGASVCDLSWAPVDAEVITHTVVPGGLHSWHMAICLTGEPEKESKRISHKRNLFMHQGQWRETAKLRYIIYCMDVPLCE